MRTKRFDFELNRWMYALKSHWTDNNYTLIIAIIIITNITYKLIYDITQ